MKIAHLVGHGGLNGVATSSRMLIQAQLDAGHDIMLVQMKGSWIGGQPFNGRIRTVTSDLLSKPDELRRVGYAIRDWGEDVVHAHGSRANKFGLVFRCAAGTPVVMTAHARQFQLPWLFAHEVIAPSKWTADYYASHMLVARRHLHLIPNMFDTGSIAPATAERRSEARRALGIRDDAFLIGSVGHLSQRKNQLDMVGVLRGLLAGGVDAELLVIGADVDGVEPMPGWNAALAGSDVQGRVHLPGQRKDALNLLPAFDLFLMTSRDEQAPIAPLEAMAAEIAVLSTRVGNMVDLLPEERLFAVGDVEGMTAAALRLQDNALRATLGAQDRQTLGRKLAPPRIVSEIDGVYRLAMERAGRGPRRHAA